MQKAIWFKILIMISAASIACIAGKKYVAIPVAPAFPDPVTLTYAGTSTGNIFTATMAGKTDAILSGSWDRAVANGIVGTAGTPRRFRNADASTVIGNAAGAYSTDQCFKSLNSSNYVEVYGKSPSEPFIMAGNRNGLQWNALAAGAQVKAVNVVCKDLSFAGTLINTGDSTLSYLLVDLKFYRVFGLMTEGEGLYLGSTNKTNYSVYTVTRLDHIFIYNKARDGVQLNNHLDVDANHITVWDVGKLNSANQNNLIQIQNCNGTVRNSIFHGAPVPANIFTNGFTFDNCYFRWDASYFYIGRLLTNYASPEAANNLPITFRNCIFDPVNNVTDLFRVVEDGCNFNLENCIVSNKVSNLFWDNRVDTASFSLSDTGTSVVNSNDIEQVTLLSTDANNYKYHGLCTSRYHHGRGMGYRSAA